jgi:hypothetical protein
LAGKRGGHGEAVDIRKLNVEQDQVRAQLAARANRLRPVRGLPHHEKPVRRQDLARDRSEGRMIVDNQYAVVLGSCRAGGNGVILGTERSVRRAVARDFTHGVPR